MSSGEEGPREDRGRDSSGSHKPRSPWGPHPHPKLKRQEGPFPGALRGSTALLTPCLQILAPKVGQNMCLLVMPVCGHWCSSLGKQAQAPPPPLRESPPRPLTAGAHRKSSQSLRECSGLTRVGWGLRLPTALLSPQDDAGCSSAPPLPHGPSPCEPSLGTCSLEGLGWQERTAAPGPAHVLDAKTEAQRAGERPLPLRAGGPDPSPPPPQLSPGSRLPSCCLVAMVEEEEEGQIPEKQSKNTHQLALLPHSLSESKPPFVHQCGASSW